MRWCDCVHGPHVTITRDDFRQLMAEPVPDARVRWEPPYGMRLGYVAALKASGRVYQVRKDYYVDSVNWLKLYFYDDRTELGLPHSVAVAESRGLTDAEAKRWIV